MFIKKIFNNNVVLTENESGREIIVMGRGIAFNHHVGDKISSSDVERTYTLSSKGMMEKFQELVASISSEYLKAADEIVDYAQNLLECKLNESIFVSLTDHIHMAVYRIRNGIEIRSMFLMEIQKFYEKEFSIGLKALEIINHNFNVTMPEDEATFIAMHIIDAQTEFNVPIANKIMQMIHEITNVIRMVCKIELDKNSIQYYRLVTHLKFFAKRVLTEQASEDEMSLMVQKKYPQAYECANKIAELIFTKYRYKINSDEKFYLTIHIAKVISTK